MFLKIIFMQLETKFMQCIFNKNLFNMNLFNRKLFKQKPFKSCLAILVSRLNNQSGSSVMAFSLALSIAAVTTYYGFQKYLESQNQAMRQIIMSGNLEMITSEFSANVWFHESFLKTISDNSNPGNVNLLSCLNNPAFDCAAAGVVRNINLFAPSGAIYIAANGSGFNQLGQPCTVGCPFTARVQWVPDCPAAPAVCVQPPVKLELTITQDTSVGSAYPIKTDRFTTKLRVN